LAKYVFIHSHPIQYLAPMYASLTNKGLDLEVWYCSKHGLKGEFDKEFKTNVKWDVDLLSGYPYEFFKNQGTRRGIYSFFGLLNFGLIHKIKKLDKDDILVLHGWNYASYLLAFLTGLLFGKKMALRTEMPHNQESKKKGFRHSIRKALVHPLFIKRFKYYFFVGKQNKRFYTELGIQESSFYFTPYCVDNRRFQLAFESTNKKDLRNKYRLSNSDQVVLYSGKLIPKKRPLDLLQVALKNKNTQSLFFIFMGDGELKAEMESFIHQNELDNVRITGFINQSEVSEYYALSDVFIMCSGIGETWGLSTNEAMNFCLPILVSETCGNAMDLVHKGVNGFTFKEGDVEEIQEVLTKLLAKSTSERAKMGIESQNIISEYSYDTVYQNISPLI
jgi:glycosyltransferase involved in cell wall biosynthesis